MNLEEIKYRIIEQFKQPNSPIRDLMLKDLNLDPTSNGSYFDSFYLWSKKHDFFARIERRLTDEWELGFQVSFMKSIPKTTLPNKVKEIDEDSAFGFRYKEVVSISNKTIKFCIEQQCNRCIDYEVTRLVVWCSREIEYDIEKMCFLNEDTIKSVVESWNEMASGRKTPYVVHKPTVKLLHEISSIANALHVTTTDKQKLLREMGNIRFHRVGAEATLSQIVKALAPHMFR